MTVLALAFAAASIAGCIVLGVVADRQRHTIDRLAQDVDDLWGTGNTLDLDTDRVDHISVMNQKLENLRESTEALTRKDHTND